MAEGVGDTPDLREIANPPETEGPRFYDEDFFRLARAKNMHIPRGEAFDEFKARVMHVFPSHLTMTDADLPRYEQEEEAFRHAFVHGLAEWAIQHTEFDKLKQKAENDDLTGFLKRDAFAQLVYERSQDPDRHLALLHCDFDRFKEINDSNGHAAGDDALRAFSEYLRSILREGDVVCRYGGDEFTILAEFDANAPRVEVEGDGEEPLSPEESMVARISMLLNTNLTEKVEQAVGKPLVVKEEDGTVKPYGNVSISIGYTTITPEDTAMLRQSIGLDDKVDIKPLVDRADEKLYAVKEARRMMREGNGSAK